MQINSFFFIFCVVETVNSMKNTVMYRVTEITSMLNNFCETVNYWVIFLQNWGVDSRQLRPRPLQVIAI